MEKIIRYIIDPHLFPPEVVRALDYAMYFFVAFSVFLILSTLYFYIKAGFLREKYLKDVLEFTKTSPYKDIKVPKDWSNLEKRITNEDGSDRKLAVIEADDMITTILGEMGYEGESLPECLEEVSTDIVPNKEDLLRVNKTRRDLTYDPNYDLSIDQTKEIMEVYKQTLKDLGLL